MPFRTLTLVTGGVLLRADFSNGGGATKDLLGTGTRTVLGNRWAGVSVYSTTTGLLPGSARTGAIGA